MENLNKSNISLSTGSIIQIFHKFKFLESKEGACPSLTWKSIFWGKSLLHQGLRKRIGNGQSTMAFKDPWIPRPSSFLPITRGSNENMKVSEFIQIPGKWNRELIQQNYLVPDSELILTIPLSPFNHSDSWFWHYSKNGFCSVRSGYSLAKSASGPSSSAEVLSTWWKSFWEIKIPRKILIFGWRGYHEILPTIKGLYRRNVSVHSNCPLCGFGEDSNAHAVFWCPVSQEFWALLDFPFLIGNKEEITFNGVLLYASELLDKEEFAKVLIAAWIVWTERNKKTHGQQQRTPQQMKTWFSNYYEEISNVNTPGNGVVSEEKSSHRGQAEDTELQFHDHTLLVDAAISTSSNKVGLGAVILAPDKKVQAALSKPLEGNLSVFHAEVLALLVGLRWAQTVGFPILKIFRDSLSLVQALRNRIEYQNELGILLPDIRMSLSSFSEAEVGHINRKFNVKAHKLAKHAIQLDDESSWMEEIPHSDNHNM